MRILLQSRRDLRSLWGGDSVQVEKTAEALRARGHDARVSLELSPDLAGVDVVHLFNLNRVHETLLQARAARRRGVPIVLSPVWHDLSEYEARGRHGLLAAFYRRVRSPDVRELFTSAVSFARSPADLYALAALARTGFREAQREALAAARALAPNSRMELAQLRRDFPGVADETPASIAYYAVDPAWTASPADPERFRARVGLRDFVLCVGRIGARKNQLGLAEALAGTDLPLVLAGKEFNKQYAGAIRAAAGDRVRFAGMLAAAELRSAYAAARVHAQPSWFETCGLASLEAAACGTPVVVSDRGYTREYFGEEAFYADPASPDSIRKAALEAWEAPRGGPAAARIAREFTWERTAEATLAAYEAALGGAPC